MQEILAAVDGIDADPVTKRKFRELVRQVGGAHGLQWIGREDRITFVSGLLARRVSRATIRDRLIALYGVSRGQAYRIIGSAMKLSPCDAENET